MDLVRLGAIVDGEEKLASRTEQVVKVEDLVEDGGIAEGRSEVRVLKSAAQAAFNVLRAGGIGELKVMELSSDLFKDSGRGGKDASDEESKASDGGAADGGGQGISDALKDGLVQWVESRHG